MKTLIKMGFTLTELLVVVAIMGMLAGILMPTLHTARERGRRAVCVGNLKVIGEAFNMYNIDTSLMPPGTAGVQNRGTNLIKLTTSIIGLGYFYDDPAASLSTDNYIEDFAVFVCPSSSYIRDPAVLKREWNANNNTYSAYLYRARSGYPPPPSPLILSDAKPALVMDYNCESTLEYNHKGEYVNILFRNGNVKGVENIPDPNSPPKKILTLTPLSVNELNRVSQNADEQ